MSGQTAMQRICRFALLKRAARGSNSAERTPSFTKADMAKVDDG